MTQQLLTPHQSQYIAWLLTRRAAGDSVESLASTLVDAQIDLNPHQVDAALFACRNPLSRGVILANELDEDYESLDETAEEFGERSNGQAGFRRAEPRRARYHLERDRRATPLCLGGRLEARVGAGSQGSPPYCRSLADAGRKEKQRELEGKRTNCAGNCSTGRMRWKYSATTSLTSWRRSFGSGWRISLCSR
ncbi:MAG: hypothetical protein LBQ81_01645 [Zoogloeaceae bacterium]|jgi:hypothetical protein|nr:hypothetical protein [Zoogloeaceae bacterium]